MIALPGWFYSSADNHPSYSEVEAARRLAEAEKRRHCERGHRIKFLVREIMFAKRKLQEYDRFLDELGKLRQEELDYSKRLCAAPRRR